MRSGRAPATAPPAHHVGRASCEVDQDGGRLVDWNPLRPDRREVRREDHHAGGATQSIGDPSAPGHSNLEAVRRAIAESLRRQRQEQTHRGVERWPWRQSGPQLEVLVAMPDRSRVRTGSELPYPGGRRWKQPTKTPQPIGNHPRLGPNAGALDQVSDTVLHRHATTRTGV